MKLKLNFAALMAISALFVSLVVKVKLARVICGDKGVDIADIMSGNKMKRGVGLAQVSLANSNES
jgi:hypothetical protein